MVDKRGRQWADTCWGTSTTVVNISIVVLLFMFML